MSSSISYIVLSFLVLNSCQLSLGSPSNMVKRALHTLSDEEKDAFVTVHNDFRRGEESSDMEGMEWDDTLAEHAQDWITKCIWDHPSDLNGEGQNLFFSEAPDVPSAKAVVTSWYEEIKDYDYDSATCNKDAVCGHYTQVVWATSYKVGCAQHLCEQITINNEVEEGWVSGCNYLPGGNYEGRQPFKKGEPCTACRSGLNCKDELCYDCSEEESGCESACNIACANGGVKRADACECDCPPGFTGETCNDICEDRSQYCGGNPGWPVSYCTDPYVSTRCPRMCGLCQCVARCENGGTPIEGTCKCTCPPGFAGESCDAPCEDYDAYCGASPGWPWYWCTNPETPYVADECPLMCGLCSVA